MESTLIYLCLFLQAYAAPTEERNTSVDAFRPRQKNDVVPDYPQRPNEHLQRINGSPDFSPENKEKESQTKASNKMMASCRRKSKVHQIKVTLVNERHDMGSTGNKVVLEKRDPRSIIRNIDTNIEGSGNIFVRGNEKQASKSDVSMEFIHHATLGTDNAETSDRKINIGKDSSRHEHSNLINARVFTTSDATLGQAGGIYNTRTGKDGNSNTGNFDHPYIQGTESTSEGDDAGISSGAGSYYPGGTSPTNTYAKNRDVLTPQNSHDSGREDGDLGSSNAISTTETGFTKAEDENGLGNEHPEWVGAGYTEVSGKQQEIECTNNDEYANDKKGADLNKGVDQNITRICIKEVYAENIRAILDEDAGFKNLSYKDVVSGRVGNVNVNTVQIAKGSNFLKGRGSYLQTKTRGKTVAKSGSSRQGRRYFGKSRQDLGNRPRSRDFQKHVRPSKRRTFSVHRKEVSSASSESSDESGQYSSSDSDQSK